MSRKQPKRRAGNMVFRAIAGIFILAIVCGVGFGVATADSSDDLARAGGFGFDAATNNTTALAAGTVAASNDTATLAAGTAVAFGDTAAHAAGKAAASSEKPEPQTYEQSVLASTSRRTIDAGLQMIDDREEAARKQAEAEAAAERERIKAENAAIGNLVAKQKAMQGVYLSEEEIAALHNGAEIYEYGLPAVDWTVGKEAFLAEWSTRIDVYLAGSPLEGCGWIFADAAWDNGVDPRWSPAISNTESSKGAVCFLPCNAWGWGASGFSDWETAIRTHVAGLAAGYGYSITPDAAAVYCPPNHDFWYANTSAQMAMI